MEKIRKLIDLRLKPAGTDIEAVTVPAPSDAATLAEVAMCNGPMPTIALDKSVFQVGTVKNDNLDNDLSDVIQKQMSENILLTGLDGSRVSGGFKNILLTTDLSPYAEAAVPFAVALAKQSGGTIHVFHAFEMEPGEVFASGVWSEVSAWLATTREKRQEQVTQVAKNLAAKTGLNITHTCVSGHPALEAVKFALEIHADVIVLSTHGRSGIPHLFLGSVAEKIVRLSPIPVLTVRPGETVPDEMKFKTILVPIDFSENSKAAMFLALEFAKLHGAKLILVNVVENVSAYSETGWTIGVGTEVCTWTEWLKSQGEKSLAEASALLASKSNIPIQTLLKYGRADEEICNSVREYKADLVVMSTHGYTGFSHLAFGSITEGVLRSCSVPILSIRLTVSQPDKTSKSDKSVK